MEGSGLISSAAGAAFTAFLATNLLGIPFLVGFLAGAFGDLALRAIFTYETSSGILLYFGGSDGAKGAKLF